MAHDSLYISVYGPESKKFGQAWFNGTQHNRSRNETHPFSLCQIMSDQILGTKGLLAALYDKFPLYHDIYSTLTASK